MLVCLGLLARKPMCFDAAAAAWHARWCGFLTGVQLADSHAALAALEAMAGPEPVSGALALSRLCKEHGLDDVAAVLDNWADAQLPPAAILRLQAPSDGPLAA